MQEFEHVRGRAIRPIVSLVVEFDPSEIRADTESKPQRSDRGAEAGAREHRDSIKREDV